MLQDPSEYTRDELGRELQVRDLMLAYFQEALKIDNKQMDTVYNTAEMTINEHKKLSDIPAIVLEDLPEHLRLLNTLTIKAIFSSAVNLVKTVKDRWQQLVDEHPEEAMEVLDRAKELEEKLEGLTE